MSYGNRTGISRFGMGVKTVALSISPASIAVAATVTPT
jgi:hypothetical protein